MIPRCGRGMDLLEQEPQKTLPQFRQWCLRFVKVNFSRHRMHTSESVHSGGWILLDSDMGTSKVASHAYRVAVKHASGYVYSRRESVAFPLQRPINLIDVHEIALTFCSDRPSLYEL